MKKGLKYSLYINAGIWLVFAFLAFSGLHYGIPQDLVSRVVIGLLASGAGGAMVLLYFLGEKYSARWYYLLLIELLFILFLTLTDEFGWPDLIVLVTHLVSLAFVAARIKRDG